MPRSGPVLVLAEQPLVAAMIGMLVELAGWQPRFARPEELPAQALARVRPLAVVLIDIRLDSVHSDLLFALAARHRVGVAVFGPGDRRDEVATVARARGLPWFTATSDVEHLALVLRAAADQEWWQRGSDRRRRAPAIREPDGTIVFEDSNGMRWTVSDRREGEDRREGGALPPGGAAYPIERLFVSASGERLRFDVPPSDVMDLSPETLEAQLSRALPA